MNQQKGYKQIGFEKAQEELNIWFNEKIKEFKHKNNNNINIDNTSNPDILLDCNFGQNE
jgi:hypothetical protein